MPKNKPKRNPNLNHLVKKTKPQSPNQKPLKPQERPQRLPWTKKPPKSKNNQSRLLKQKMEPLRRPKSKNLLHNPVKKRKPQRRLSRPSPQFKRLLFQRRKFNNNQVKKAQNNKNQSRLLRKSLPQSRLLPNQPRRLSHHLRKKARRKWSQPRRLPSHQSKNPPNPHCKSQLLKRRRSLNNHNPRNQKTRLQRSQSPRRPQSPNPPSPNHHSKSQWLQRRKSKRVNNHQANNKPSQSLRLKLKSQSSQSLNHHLRKNNKSQPRLLQSEKPQKKLLSRKYKNQFKTLKTMMKQENSKFAFKDFPSTPLMPISEPSSSHVEKSLTLTSSWDPMENQKESPSSSSARDHTWTLPLNSAELNTTEDKSRSKKPEERPLQRENKCTVEERTSVEKTETPDQLRPTPKSPPQLFSSVDFLSTQLTTQSRSSSPKPVKSNLPELLLINKLKR